MQIRRSSGKIAAIQAGYNCQINGTQTITVVISATGKIYADTVQQEYMRCEVQSVPVNTSRLIKAMHETYHLKGEVNLGEKHKLAKTATIMRIGTKQS